MKEDLVSYEVAKLAKEKGFDWESTSFYLSDKKLRFNVIVDRSYYGDEAEYELDDLLKHWNKKDWVYTKDICECFGPKVDNIKYFEAFSAPTQALLQKWLREEHNLHCNILYCQVNNHYDVWHKGSGSPDNSFSTCEEALENCLIKNLESIINEDK